MQSFKLGRAAPMLQLALDMVKIDEALQIADAVLPYFEILEVGTPLILSEGSGAVRALKSRYPAKIILADMKIADAGEYEAMIAFEAGADLVSVLGLADPRTVKGAVEAGNRLGGGVVVDCLNMVDLLGATLEFETLGAACVEIHAGTDQAHQAAIMASQIAGIARVLKIPVAVAGGISPQNIGPLVKTGASIFVAGSAVTRASDPAQVAKTLRCVVFGSEQA